MHVSTHEQDHAIEALLPLLAKLAPNTKVVGIVVGSETLPRGLAFASGLATFIRKLSKPPMLIISSDMNHYTSDVETRHLDEMLMRAIETLDPATVLSVASKNHISMCGLMPTVIVLETLRQLGRLYSIERGASATSGVYQETKTVWLNTVV